MRTRDPSLRRSLLWLGFAVVAALLVFLTWYLARVLLLTFAGILLAVALTGVSEWLSRRSGMSYPWAVGVVGFFLLLGLFLTGWLLAPRLADQADQLGQQLPRAVRQIERRLERYQWGEEILNQAPSGQQLLSADTIVSRAPDLFTTTLGVLAEVVIVLFIAVYLAFQPGLYRRGLVRLFPHRARARADEVLGAVETTLQRWLLGRAVAMAAVGLITGLGLWALNMPLALTLGLIAALLDVIPNIGPWIAAAPAVLLALLMSPEQALYVALLYLAVQSVESYLITPLVQQWTVELPPVLTIVAQVLFAILFGALGLLLATPLAAVGLVLVKMLYVHDVLGEEVELPGG